MSNNVTFYRLVGLMYVVAQCNRNLLSIFKRNQAKDLYKSFFCLHYCKSLREYKNEKQKWLQNTWL